MTVVTTGRSEQPNTSSAANMSIVEYNLNSHQCMPAMHHAHDRYSSNAFMISMAQPLKRPASGLGKQKIPESIEAG